MKKNTYSHTFLQQQWRMQEDSFGGCWQVYTYIYTIYTKCLLANAKYVSRK